MVLYDIYCIDNLVVVVLLMHECFAIILETRVITILFSINFVGILYILIMFLLIFVQVDSLEKFNKLLDACKRIGVETNAKAVGALGIIPLFSWYHEVIASAVSVSCSLFFHTMFRIESKVFL